MAILKFTKKEFWYLFLMCALPVHIWNFILLFRDAEWVVDQFGMDNLIGYSAYSMVFALGESFIFFLAVILGSLLLPRRWDKETTLATLSSLGIIILLWAIINQTYFIFVESSPAWFEWIRIRIFYNQDWVFIILGILIIASVIVPIIYIERVQKLKFFLLAAIDRLVLLVGLYLFFDVIGLITILFRIT